MPASSRPDRARHLAAVLAALSIGLGPVHAAGLRAEVGHERLAAELGPRMPRGQGLRIAQVESPVAVDTDNADISGPVMAWLPAPHRDLDAARIVDLSPGTGPRVHSRHATAVARRLIGQRTGLAAGADALDIYNTRHWLESVLNAGRPLAPQPIEARVVNHSWAADLGGAADRRLDADILRRVDWLAERDELLTVAGIRNAADRTNVPLLASAHNAIIVGRASGQHSRSTPVLDRTYTAGRVRPHIVAPGGTSSAATPVVAAAVLLLTELAADASLSTRRAAVVTRAGHEVYDAGRVETLRAIVMASARWPPDAAQRRGANGLDEHYGAGHLDIYAAAVLLLGGEREAAEVALPVSGFDYVAAIEPRGRMRYRLEVRERCLFTATLSWNLRFPGQHARRFDASAVLNDLDLALYARPADAALARAASRGDNIEHLALELSPGRYTLSVHSRADAAQDYGLAWHCRSEEKH